MVRCPYQVGPIWVDSLITDKTDIAENMVSLQIVLTMSNSYF